MRRGWSEWHASECLHGAGGRVGRGIYLASEQAKSAGYVRPGRLNGRGKQIGIMFLVEAALGKAREIKVDDSSLRAPPKGAR